MVIGNNSKIIFNGLEILTNKALKLLILVNDRDYYFYFSWYIFHYNDMILGMDYPNLRPQ